MVRDAKSCSNPQQSIPGSGPMNQLVSFSGSHDMETFKILQQKVKATAQHQRPREGLTQVAKKGSRREKRICGHRWKDLRDSTEQKDGYRPAI